MAYAGMAMLLQYQACDLINLGQGRSSLGLLQPHRYTVRTGVGQVVYGVLIPKLARAAKCVNLDAGRVPARFSRQVVKLGPPLLQFFQ